MVRFHGCPPKAKNYSKKTSLSFFKAKIVRFYNSASEEYRFFEQVLYTIFMKYPDESIMRQAIELAKKSFVSGDYAVAAIIVLDSKILTEATTTITHTQDPTAHAEVNAIRQASQLLKSKKLENCYLYTTYEPCPMCTSAAIWARMKGIVYGASREDATLQNPWRVMISSKEVIKHGTPKLELYPKFMREECKKLLQLNKIDS